VRGEVRAQQFQVLDDLLTTDLRIDRSVIATPKIVGSRP
jgi:hypothetical protein